ncbi:MAG TPA: glycosyl hydrolase [Fimbriimonadaceae bacterium]|nr:glycosyl hydrolase [Fimbriimonadaceae bacterium]
MFVHPTSRKGIALLALLALCLVTPVCGTSLFGQRRLSAPKLSLPESKIVGIGLNVHSERMPIDKLKAIGIKWVRIDLGRGMPPSAVRGLVSHYRDFGQLWTDHQEGPDPIAAAKELLDAGVTEIEVYNEPEQAHISPTDYARTFQQIRAVVNGRARLYGPSIGTWDQAKRYLNDCIDAGMRPDVLTFHGYLQNNSAQLSTWAADAKGYGLPVVVSEIGYPIRLGAVPYRDKMHKSMGPLFIETRDALRDTPWCLYDGPNPAGDNDTGLFDWDGHGFNKPNRNYDDIVAALAREKG